ncbi:MAG: tetratricopeptide repeat protein [Candidatus Ozemobacteraceae bacterium]
MLRRFLLVGCAFLTLSASCFAGTSAGTSSPTAHPASKAPVAGETIATTPTPIDGVVLSNQMMITFMERLKAGNLAEARTIALQMIEGNEQFIDTPTKEFRSFATLMGKKLYEIQAKRAGQNVTVEWVQQPIADGFYFLAMVDYQEGKVEEALVDIQKAISWDPVRAIFHIERGFLMLHKKDNIELSMVMATYIKALELSDCAEDFAAALRGLGFVLVERNDLAAGYAAYMTSKRFDPTNPATVQEMHFIEAQAPGLAKTLDDAKSITLLTERKIPVAISRIHVDVLLTIAGELTGAHQVKELKAVLRRALALDPSNQSIVKKLTELK